MLLGVLGATGDRDELAESLSRDNFRGLPVDSRRGEERSTEWDETSVFLWSSNSEAHKKYQ